MTLDTKALEAAAVAVDASWSEEGPPFDQTEREYQAHCRDTARAAIEAYLSATPSRNDILEEAATVAEIMLRYADTTSEADIAIPAAIRALVKP